MSDLARALVAKHESCRLKPYLDTVGKTTIGWGYNLSDRGITQAQADDWLTEDLDECAFELAQRYSWYAELNAVRQAVCVDMLYNVGLNGFLKFVHFLAAMTLGDVSTASVEILSSQIALARRTELALLMRTGQWSVGP